MPQQSESERAMELFITMPDLDVDEIKAKLEEEGYTPKRPSLVTLKSTTKGVLKTVLEFPTQLGLTIDQSLINKLLPPKEDVFGRIVELTLLRPEIKAMEVLNSVLEEGKQVSYQSLVRVRSAARKVLSLLERNSAALGITIDTEKINTALGSRRKKAPQTEPPTEMAAAEEAHPILG